MLKTIGCLFLYIVFISSGFSQSKEISSLQIEVNEGNHKKALSKLLKFDKSILSAKDNALYNYLLAKCFEMDNRSDEALSYYLKAIDKYRYLHDDEKVSDINLDIAYLHFAQDKNKNISWEYLGKYEEYAKKTNDTKRLAQAYTTKGDFLTEEGKFQESLKYYNKALLINRVNGDNKIQSTLYNNLGVLYNEYLKNHDSALYYYKKDLPFLIQTKDSLNICYNYINQAGSYYYMGEHQNAINYLKKADSININKYVFKVKQAIYNLMSLTYSDAKQHEKAYHYLTLYQNYSDSLNKQEQDLAIDEIQTKYQTKEKELENLKLKNNATTNRILIYIFLGLLAGSVVIGFLIIKNSRRKEKISRQEKLIEQQQFEKTLKDYELNSIDMMLEGQEKERQRLANDLHDNLGSMLATLKLNFEHLKLRKNELRDEETKLYERTDELIEEAYQKVRRLAHAKNVGVLANEGLIPALKKLADKISIPGQLQIHVVPFGFDERIENTLEIAIFRMIQELATNIIKHAKATEATIHLTHHENNINIIVEDNGIGFDSLAIETADGMGITSIKRKAEQLGGTMTIDSTAGKGTTIIIDIPV